MMRNGEFLKAEWRQLVLLNYEIDPQVLAARVPESTELDLWNGKAYVSIVGFLFLNTTVLGIPIPFHRNFEEVNLRFYVRRKGEDGWRRGVVFVKELVPRFAIALVARSLYSENYQAVRMDHTVDERTGFVEYRWHFDGAWNRLSATAVGEPADIPVGSFDEFIAEHYWGYTRTRTGETSEYRIDHPRWRVRQVSESVLECKIAQLYGPEFESALNSSPASVFWAEGSEITVFHHKATKHTESL